MFDLFTTTSGDIKLENERIKPFAVSFSTLPTFRCTFCIEKKEGSEKELNSDLSISFMCSNGNNSSLVEAPINRVISQRIRMYFYSDPEFMRGRGLGYSRISTLSHRKIDSFLCSQVQSDVEDFILPIMPDATVSVTQSERYNHIKIGVYDKQLSPLYQEEIEV